jgi:uncharacterized protein (DUF1778 family)
VSDGVLTFPGMKWDPEAELERRKHLKLVWVDRGGRRGCIDFRTGEVRVRRSDPPHERKCVMSHELVHDERGPVPRWLTAREESTVREESARRLIALDALAQALRWTSFITEAAAELAVDVPTLQARLITLTDDERAELSEALKVVPHVGLECHEEE